MKVGDLCKFKEPEFIGYDFLNHDSLGVILQKEWFIAEATWIYHIYFADTDLTLWFRQEELNTAIKVNKGEANE
tara:strand:+ start:1910 stop:2131 length:222 start_codon:yes stop_codon:yes gene_type:complete